MHASAYANERAPARSGASRERQRRGALSLAGGVPDDGPIAGRALAGLCERTPRALRSIEGRIDLNFPVPDAPVEIRTQAISEIQNLCYGLPTQQIGSRTQQPARK